MAGKLSILNDPPKLLEGPQLLHKLIQWRLYSDSCAFDCTNIDNNLQYTYQEVESCVECLISRIQDALAKSMHEANTSQRQHIVPILLPQSPGLYISQLAILSSGGAFCPINLDSPLERNKFIVGDVKASILITTSEFRDIVTWQNGPSLILIDEFPEIKRGHEAHPSPTFKVRPDDLAYVMYTSGSTGLPKGVGVSHLAASQSLLAHEKHIPKFKRFLQFAAPSFDVSVFEIFFPLTRGCTLVSCNKSRLMNDLPGAIRGLNIDAAELTPTVVGSLLQKRSNAPGLKLLLTIGEPLTTPIVKEFGGSETQPNLLYGMYGPTEAAIHCTIFPEMRSNTKPGNIGIPFDTVSTFIAAPSEDAENVENASILRFLPVGETGELVLGGPQLARGYLNRPDQNKRAFVQFKGKKYYRTGDKACQLEDGTIQIFGRISSGQVKLRGQRIELGEIEEAIYKHPGVKTVSAVVLNSTTLLVFALVTDKIINSQDVISTSAKWLPKYMVPNEVVLLQSFPYLPSGKVNKKQLEVEYLKRVSEGQEEQLECTNEIEKIVFDILGEILGPISRSTKLAASGLDSLVAIRVASKLRLNGFNITTIEVIQADNVNSLVQTCRELLPVTSRTQHTIKSVTAKASMAVLNGHAQDLEYPLPCTPLQLAMLSETAQDPKAYWNWVQLELQGATDFKQIAVAVQTLAQSNEILRTGFIESDNSQGFAQLIWKDLPKFQIVEVKELKYALGESKELSLHHPVRFQVLKTPSNFKVLMHIHHALYDAWSLELLLDDLDNILAARQLQDRPSFSKIAAAYADGTLKTDDWASKEYWNDHLSDLEIIPLTTFQVKRTKPALEILKYGSSIPTKEVSAIARQLSASPQSIFQAAFALILSSYLGSSDICFGTVSSGRTLPIVGIEDIAGPCIATLPIRVDIATSTNLRDLVQQLNSTTRKHLEHSTVTLRDIKSAAGVIPHQALFDTLLIWQQTLHPYDHARSHVSLIDTVDNLEFSLTLEVIPTCGNIKLKANYQQSLLPEPQVKLLLQQMEIIVKAIISDPSGLVTAVYNRLEDDLLSIENGKCDTRLKGHTLSSTVEKIATQDPERIAINFIHSLNGTKSDIQEVSYSQLNNRANQIRSHILNLGVVPDELVCICMDKSVDLYISILGIVKAGAGYLPLTSDIPRERLEYILQGARVKVVITKSSCRALFNSCGSVKVVYVDEVDFGKSNLKNIQPKISPDHVAYCVFTSGSTGTPKGVLVTYRNLLSNLDVLEELYPISKNARLLQSCSQAFDVSVFEIFFTWRIGGCLCSATKDVLFQDLEKTIAVLEITHLSLTPTVAALVNPGNIPTVKFLVTAGEAVTPKVFNAWADRGLWQGYGPSETTNICTINPRVSKDDLINNIGPPFKNTSAFVLASGDNFCIVPKGGVGEFCFGGSQVFRGYMDQTQNIGKIIDHPKFGRLYRSGDFGRMMPDGSLVFTGRKDEQVKIRGQRVELGEISNLLLKSEQVKDCITIVLGDSGSQRLVSFWTSGLDFCNDLICLDPDQSVIKDLYSHLNSALPAYMIPSALVPISFLPSTTQGKIDKRALLRLFSRLDLIYLDSASQAKESVSNHVWTNTQKNIAEAVAQVTQLPTYEINAETSFFNLGIHSISAILLSRILQKNTGYQVSISDILKFPSVVRLAEKITSQGPNTGSASAPASKSSHFDFDEKFQQLIIQTFEEHGKSVEHVLPCTPLQEAMLSATEASSQSLYDNHVTLNITGDVEKLQQCWQEMVQRHEILRTCFFCTDIAQFPFVQVILKRHNLSFNSITSLADRKPLPKDFEPLYRLDIMGSGKSSKLVISMHHALYDGEALAILYEEVENLYQQKQLPPPVSFAPFLQAMSTLDLNAVDRFWSKVLKNCIFAKFNHLHQQSNEAQNHIQIHQMKLKFPLQWVEERTKRYNTSLLAVLHTIWVTIISERLQESDICFGNVVSGRTLSVPDLDRLVAPCFNTIPSRLQHIDNLTYLAAFRKFQALNADSIPFQLTPLRRIQSRFSPNGSRLFDTLFILQQSPRELNSSIWSIEDDSGAMDFPLVCEVVPRTNDNTVEVVLHSDSHVISEGDAQAILKSFEEKLGAALENPRRQLLDSITKEQINLKTEAREAKNSKPKEERAPSMLMSEDEKKLRDVIADFTNVPLEKISRDTSIFRLGLDSITTVQVATRLKKLGHSIIGSDVLAHPTIAQLNSFLSGAAPPSPIPLVFDFDAFDKEYRKLVCSKSGIEPTDVEIVRPCTAVQQGMLAQTLHSCGQEYVNSIWFELLPDTSIVKLRQAWEDACKEHEMFRTRFFSTEDPKYPFLMVTYRKETFSLPWFNSSTDHQTSPSMIDLVHPWRLIVSQNENKVLIQFTAHHALYDAESMQMLLLDLGAKYSSKPITNRPPVSSLLGTILLQCGHNIEEKKSFWKKEENMIVVNKFPNLNPLRVSETTNTVREITSKIPLSKLEEMCRANSITMQAASQATWARLLAAYIGETSTTFGITLSGRTICEDADLIAFPSIVTLPVRCNVSGTNADLLTNTMESNALLHKHQFTPLTLIQKWSGYPEGKIFDTLFAYQKFPGGSNETELPWKVIREEASVDYAISLEVQPTKDGYLMLRLTFAQNLIPAEHAGLILHQYDLLLLDTLQNPSNASDTIPQGISNDFVSITPAQQNELVSSITFLHEFVERGAKFHPDKIALEFATCLEPEKFQSRTWSYSQLNQESNRIANMLLGKGVLPGEIIAICFDKCAEASFAIIGILKVGCAFVALDPKAPADRLKFITKDSETKLIITAGMPGNMLEELMLENVINLDLLGGMANYSSQQPTLARAITPQDISYCLYTSGTTGTPKGCLLTHENAVQFMLAFTKLFENHWTENSKYLQFASFHFDVSVMEQFWSWCVGITVASAPRDLIFEDLASAIRQLRITHIDLTPSLARTIHPDEVPLLCKGAFITGGESLKQEILDDWGEFGMIYNGYGPTEVTIGCTMYPRVPKNGRPDNIGPAYINVGSYVLKPGTEQPVLRGAVGELCVSGKLLGKGYLNRPDLTAERFPTLSAFGERIYRTGDLVRILHDGSFIFLGRADDQVKLRGQRLELSEINEVIKHSIVSTQEVVTQVIKHNAQQKEQLVTFFVTESEEPSQLVPSMRDACRSKLPSYMVPTHFIPIKNIPLNANNKADKKQLAVIYNKLNAGDLQKLNLSSQKHRGWLGKEKRVLGMIAKAIGVEQDSLNPETTIFELGLDSISIIGFSRALQHAGLGTARLSVVKSNPSIGKLVHALLSSPTSDLAQENSYIAASQKIIAFSQRHMVTICMELEVDSSEVENVSPCTPVQEGMIYRFLESEKPLYFNKFQFNLHDEVDQTRLFKAWDRVIQNLEILRTQFIATDDGFAQVVLKHRKNSLKVEPIDYSKIEKITALKNPYSIGLESNMLSFTIFHGLYDGNSLTMLFHRVIDEYQGLQHIYYGPSFTSSLPYGPLADIPRAESFWTEYLKKWSPTTIGKKFESTEDVIVTSTINNLLGFETLRKRLGVTPQAMMQAAWLSALQSIASQNLTVGIITSGRAIDFGDAGKVIGPLFNTIPFHIKLEAGMSSAALISACHEFNMQMQDFQHTPLKDIQRWSPAKIGESLFETLFAFQRSGLDDENFARDVWTEVENHQVADYLLAFEASLSNDSSKLSMTIVAQGSVLTQSSASKLLDEVQKRLKTIIETSGENIILDHDVSTGDILSQSQNEREILPERFFKSENGSFIWNEEANQIRTEIALLANIPEDTIKETSSIFELGLDSIDVIKLSSRLKKHGIKLPVSMIVKCQTIDQMLFNSKSQPKGVEVQRIPLKQMSYSLRKYLMDSRKLPDGVEEVLPATPLQQTMVNEMIKSKFERYFNVDGFRVGDNINLAKLMVAVGVVINKYPILRTTFVEIDDPKLPIRFAQIIHKKVPADYNSPPINIAEGQKFEDFMEQFKFAAIEKATKFQQLLQVCCAANAKSNYLLIAISHALYDGTSLQLIHDDIRRAYHQDLSPRPDIMPFLEQVFQSTTDDAKKFWKTTLSNIPPMSFPRNYISGVGDFGGVTKIEKLSQVSLDVVEALCRSTRITLQTLGQTCWAFVLSHLIGQLDIVFGSVMSCRNSEEASEVMFPLMNTVAVRSVLHGTLGDMLKYMQELSDNTRQYEHFPLGTAQAYALASRKSQDESTDATLFDTLFIYQGRRSNTKVEQLYEPVYGVSDTEYPICVEMEIIDNKRIQWVSACKSFARNSAETEALLEAMETVLQKIVSQPDIQTVVSETDGISVCGLPKFKPRTVVPRHTGSQLTNGTHENWTDTELSIRKALHELSNIPEDAIQKETTIFHLGLDSILVLKLPALLKTCGIKISVSNILKDQTVLAMAKSAQRTEIMPNENLDVEAILHTATSSSLLAVILAGLEKRIGRIHYAMPATAGQLYMIRQWQATNGAMFFQTFTYVLSEPVDKKRLESAWRTLLANHDILRTGFSEVGSQVFQVIYENPPDEVLYHTQNRYARPRTANGDLNLPPLSLVVEERNAAQVVIKVVIHHALYDGISLPILIEELQMLYQGQKTKALSLSFKNFVAQSISAYSTVTTREKWELYLSKARTITTDITNNNSSSRVRKVRKRTEVFHPDTKISNIKQLAQKVGVSVDTLFLASICQILAHRLQNINSPAHEIIIGVYLANRAPFGEDLSALAAPTLNLLPLCIHEPLGRTIAEIAEGIQKDLQLISSADMVSASLADIYEWTGVQVNCFVNILKSSSSGVDEAGSSLDESGWQPVRDLKKRAEVLDETLNEDIVAPIDGRCDAYLPSLDLELRYHDDMIDMGVFAPNEMLSIAEAESMIYDFTSFWI